MKVAIILKNYLKVTGDDDGGDGSGEGGGGKKRSGRGLIKKRGKEDREGKGGGKHRNETRQRNVVAVSEERVYKK